MKYKFKTVPYDHQVKALEMSWNKETYAYFMEMGTGKTKVLIDNIAPKGVMGTWFEGEIPLHLPLHIEKKVILWQANINQKQQDKLDTLFTTGYDLHILIMNVEALSTTKGVKFAYKFISSHKTLMVVDESTTIKNPKAKRTKNIIKLSKFT